MHIVGLGAIHRRHLVSLADYVFDQLSILKSLRKHEIATDSLRVLIVSGALEVVALLQ